MKVHNININNKFFEPINNGQITLLIFDKKKIHNEKPGDCIVSKVGAYEIRAVIKKTYIKSFDEITDEEAIKAGFLNKDFLKDDLINRFDIEPLFDLEKITTIKDELFFLIEIEGSKKELNNNTLNVNLYTNESNKDYYINDKNYYTKLWKNKLFSYKDMEGFLF